jgi:hypothetical protein
MSVNRTNLGWKTGLGHYEKPGQVLVKYFAIYDKNFPPVKLFFTCHKLIWPSLEKNFPYETYQHFFESEENICHPERRAESDYCELFLQARHQEIVIKIWGRQAAKNLNRNYLVISS